MAVNETIITGRKWRKLVDEANKLWQRISFWTKASDVEFDDGQTAENKMGAISGITSDINGESENIAASIKVVNQLNNNLKGFEPIVDSTGRITGYKTKAGADTVFPFMGSLDDILSNSEIVEGSQSLSYGSHTIELKSLPKIIILTYDSSYVDNESVSTYQQHAISDLYLNGVIYRNIRRNNTSGVYMVNVTDTYMTIRNQMSDKKTFAWKIWY